jgi:hypothetical protein
VGELADVGASKAAAQISFASGGKLEFDKDPWESGYILSDNNFYTAQGTRVNVNPYTGTTATFVWNANADNSGGAGWLKQE